MNPNLRWTALLLLAALIVVSLVVAEDSSEEEVSAIAEHMHGHLDSVIAMKAAVISGNLAGVAKPAKVAWRPSATIGPARRVGQLRRRHAFIRAQRGRGEQPRTAAVAVGNIAASAATVTSRADLWSRSATRNRRRPTSRTPSRKCSVTFGPPIACGRA